MVEYSSRDSPYILDEKHGDEYSPHKENSLRSLKVEKRSCKANNNRIIQSQERLARAQDKQEEVNEVILQSLSYLQR